MKDKTKLIIWCRGLSPSSRTVRQFHLNSFQPSPFPGINNITVPVKKGSRWYGWLTSEEGVAIMIQSLTSIIALVTVSGMLKAMHVALLTYLSLKSPLTITIPMYYIIYQNNKYMDTLSQSQSVQRQQSRTWYYKTSV